MKRFLIFSALILDSTLNVMASPATPPSLKCVDESTYSGGLLSVMPASASELAITADGYAIRHDASGRLAPLLSLEQRSLPLENFKVKMSIRKCFMSKVDSHVHDCGGPGEVTVQT